MSILSGFFKTKKYRKTDSGYKLQSEWTSSQTVQMDDGNTAETNLGAIKGITDSLTATSSNVALSANGGNNLQTQIDTINSNLSNISDSTTDIGYINAYGDKHHHVGISYSNYDYSSVPNIVIDGESFSLIPNNKNYTNKKIIDVIVDHSSSPWKLILYIFVDGRTYEQYIPLYDL